MLDWLLGRIKQAIHNRKSKRKLKQISLPNLLDMPVADLENFINQNQGIIKKTHPARMLFNLHNLIRTRVATLENFINQNHDFVEEAYPSHPARILWNE